MRLVVNPGPLPHCTASSTACATACTACRTACTAACAARPHASVPVLAQPAHHGLNPVDEHVAARSMVMGSCVHMCLQSLGYDIGAQSEGYLCFADAATGQPCMLLLRHISLSQHSLYIACRKAAGRPQDCGPPVEHMPLLGQMDAIVEHCGSNEVKRKRVAAHIVYVSGKAKGRGLGKGLLWRPHGLRFLARAEAFCPSMHATVTPDLGSLAICAPPTSRFSGCAMMVWYSSPRALRTWMLP